MIIKLLSIVVFLANVINALSLSSLMEAYEKQHCFYSTVEDPGKTLHFYYSESVTKLAKSNPNASPVKLSVFGPGNEVIQEHQPKAVMETTVVVQKPGLYSFCLSHGPSPSRKVIDIDLSESTPENRTSSGLTVTDDSKNVLGVKLEKTNQKLRNDLEDLLHTLKYIKNREKRNMETVEEANSRVWWFSLLECALVVGMAILQVTILRQLFGTNSRPRV